MLEGAEDDDKVVREEDEYERVEEGEDDARVKGVEDGDDDDDDGAAELAFDDAKLAAAARLTLDVLKVETLEPLLLELNADELLLDGAELLATAELLAAAGLLVTDKLLLSEAEIVAADAPALELDGELDDDASREKGRATCEEVGAAGVDMLRMLEDERATDDEVEDGFTEEAVEDGFTDVEVAFDEVLLIFKEDAVEVGFCCGLSGPDNFMIRLSLLTFELELEDETLLLLEVALLDDETLVLLVALLLADEVVEVDTGLAIVLSLRDDEDEVFFELEETGLLVDLAVVFADEVEEVTVDFCVVTILTWVFKVVLAVVFFVDDDFLVEDDFFVEDDFLVEVVLCVELVLVTALSTSSTLQYPDSGSHLAARSIPVVSVGDTLLATAETSNRAKAEMEEMLRILNERRKD